MQPMRTLLVTGGTGFVCAYILRALCRDPRIGCVLCVVRARDAAGAAARLRGLYENRGLLRSEEDKVVVTENDGGGEKDEAWYEKVECLPGGDVGAAAMGLAPVDAARVRRDVDLVVHAAAEVNMLKASLPS